MVVLSPLLLVVALGVKASSPGPIFYRGVRTGRLGVPFRIFKFRTMVDGGEKLGGGTTALNDPRVTRIGHYLRRYKIDELPQLINIFRGEMSIVGPRPELPAYTALYSPDERRILTMRPGLTDQSSLRFFSLEQEVGDIEADGNYERNVFPVKNRLRLEYVSTASFAGDLSLIWQTLRRVLVRPVR